MPPEHQAAGRILIEPVGQDRWPRQAEAERVEGSLEIGTALGATMHREPRWLVDHQHQSVAMEHARQDFVRGQLGNIQQWQVFRLLTETANTPAQ